jgi:hypothetical protein
VSRIRSFVVTGEFQFVGFSGGFVGFLPLGGGGEEGFGRAVGTVGEKVDVAGWTVLVEKASTENI